MYLEITTRCNMKCDHCCGDYPKEGGDMSMEVFMKSMEIVEDYGETVCLGGGEPTLHPLFRCFVGMGAVMGEGGVFVITNGKDRHEALWLGRLAKRCDLVEARLSLDCYRDDRIDDDVIDFFRNRLKYGIRDVSVTVLGFGRGADLVGDVGASDCCCSDLWVGHDGKLWACGCKKIPLGDVFHNTIESRIDLLVAYYGSEEVAENHF